MTARLSTDQIAVAIEIPGLYDGTAVYLLKDGTYVNRLGHDLRWNPRLAQAANKWITQHGDQFREANRDLFYVPTESTEPAHDSGKVNERAPALLEAAGGTTHPELRNGR